MATNPFSSQSISGYNTSPPADDGSQVGSNQLNWSKHKTKLGDPIKTLAEAINSQALTAFAKVINTDADENNAMAGSLAFTESTLTIVTGAVTALRSAHIIAAESGTADTLDSIATTSVSDGALLHIRPDAGDTITVTDAGGAAGEIHLADNADYAMSGDMSLTLQRRGADWYEIARDQVLPATQAQMEADTATNVAVTPSVFKHSPWAVKHFVEFDGTDASPDGTKVGQNVGTIVDNGTGSYTVPFDTALSAATYAAGINMSSSQVDFADGFAAVVDKVAASYRVDTEDTAGSNQDFAQIDVIICGDI